MNTKPLSKFFAPEFARSDLKDHPLLFVYARINLIAIQDDVFDILKGSHSAGF